jgi:hypothetical protein
MVWSTRWFPTDLVPTWLRDSRLVRTLDRHGGRAAIVVQLADAVSLLRGPPRPLFAARLLHGRVERAQELRASKLGRRALVLHQQLNLPVLGQRKSALKRLQLRLERRASLGKLCDLSSGGGSIEYGVR